MRKVWVLGLACLLAMGGCGRKAALDEASADAWSKLLIGHTSGVVPRKSEVRVLFAGDVGAEKKLDGTLRVEPAIDGELTLRGTRELVLVPKAALTPGQEYRVTLSPKGLTGVPQDIAPYQFTFHVQTPQYELVLQDLESDPQQDQRMIQRGIIATADAEDAASVEKMLRATFRGNAVTPTWTHAGNGREHSFTLVGIERQQAGETLSLDIDGKAIGAGGSETRSVMVPAIGEFAVVNAVGTEEAGRKQIQISFSDNLDATQDLKGLVQLSDGGFTTRIEGNRILLYPADDPEGQLTVTVEAGVRNRRNEKLAQTWTQTLTLASQKPQVRFVGNGVVLPDAKQLTVPFEAVSARSVQVIATRVFPENIPQFLQVNALGGNYDIGRVGRYLWRKTLALTGPSTGLWQRYEIDVTELMQRYPGALIQLTLQLTPPDSAYTCQGGTELQPANVKERGLVDQEDNDSRMDASWEYSGEYFGVAEDGGEVDWDARWRDRKDPCRNAYYLFGYNEGVRAQRNLIASNLGLLAKADTQGKLTVSVTNLATAQPVSGVTLQLRNYQNQPVGSGSTDGDGMATLVPSGTPYLLVAENGKDRGYLRLNTSGALPVSHFEVGGETIQKGLKGAIYGERGVWRPGDAMPLTFVVYDREKTLPENHPATLELRDPRGRVVQTLVNAKPVDGFYRFDAHTAADAPTGNWSAKVSLGGASFTRALKVETVMPNRLKVTLDLGTEILGAGRPIAGKIDSEWLSGASAAGLKTDVNLRLSATRTRFTGFDNYVFDDPAREYRAEPEEIFAGDLDANASVRFEKKLDLGDAPPGMLAANFTTRVFERGGAFSIQYDARDYAPYERFVGLKLPTAKRDTLQVDEDHTVDIASVTARGAAVANRKLSVKLYKIDWRWWWDRGNDSLASYVTRESSTRVREGTVTTNAQGKAQWQFRVGQSQWGRYLLRVCDEEGGHCTGSVFYLDWPYWVGEGRDQAGPAATMLDLTADKESYQVGDTAVVQLPQSAQGRALVTVENGSAVLAAKWITPTQQDSRVSIPITAAMTPNAYVAVTLIQPHAGKKNDRPIRLYGVIPLVVTDPATQLKPALQVADEWRPESEVSVKVSEAQGKAMTYTLAVVDEGLLSLTNFRTPDLHGEFFRREALGVRTWDLFDEVSGAYGMALERLLALGGSDGAAANAANQQQSRFPPLAQLLGPFELPAGKTQEQKVKLPRYVGAVRVMVVAGSQATKPAAYGSTEKSVRVRQPLMILPTLPRVVGPGEEITVPVSVFAMNDQIRNVQLTIAPDSNFEIVGGATTTLVFERQGEKIGLLKLRAAQKLGMAKVRFTATSGNERAQDEINIELRSPNPPSTRLVSHMLQPGEAWTAALKPHGIAGTNRVTLEVSRIPPVNLENRLEYLISYPHGCLEQTTSAVFPQLFLGSLMNLDAETLRRAEANVRAGISKLRDFQLVNGAFSYWPGGAYEASGYSQWAAIYASHFLVEAEKKGYTVPAALRAGMVRSLRAMAQSWRVTESAPLSQAYRLYVLARAGQPEVGAMNRLREVKMDGVERWVLAAAYQLAGLGDAARQLATGDPMAGRDYRADDYTFGSTLRDHALVLQSMVILNQLDRAEPLVREISKSLSGDGWYSTQETAYSLLAISQLAGARTDPGGFTYTRTVAGKSVNATSKAALDRNVLDGVPDAGTDLVLRNTSQGILFATVTLRGTPPPQAEEASAAGLEMQVAYSDVDGNPVDLAKLKQGEDIAVDITLRNTTRSRVDNIALTQIVPSGWEIRNDRLGGSDDGTGDRDADNRRQNLRNQRAARADYVDIRDDRVMQYFSLDAGATIRFQTNVNAAYRGRYYLPGIVAEAMYDATRNARSAGRWTEVVAQ